jgi:hypothetical protein
MGFHAVSEAVGQKNYDGIRQMNRAPGVARNLLAQLGKVYGADSERPWMGGRNWFWSLAPPTREDAGAFLGNGVEVGLLRQADDRAKAVAGSTTSAKTVLQGLLEVSHPRPLIERQQIQPGGGFQAIGRGIQDDLAASGMLQQVGAGLGGYNTDLLGNGLVQTQFRSDATGKAASFGSFAGLVD